MAHVIGASWWCAYIGGPRSLGSGWTPALCQDLIKRGLGVLPTYGGQQSGDTLTFAQGQHDGHDACNIMAEPYGWEMGIVCLDVEAGTFNNHQISSIDYAASWVSTVRAHGYSPMVYGTPGALIALSHRNPDQVPDQVWVASWVSHEHDPDRDPARIHLLPDNLWPDNQRAWQYAAEFDEVHCRVQDLDVDISCSNCRTMMTLPGQVVDRNSAVFIEWVQRSLNQVAAAGLVVDGILGPLTHGAIRRFQETHGLEIDGIVGPLTEAAIVTAGATPFA